VHRAQLSGTGALRGLDQVVDLAQDPGGLIGDDLAGGGQTGHP